MCAVHRISQIVSLSLLIYASAVSAAPKKPAPPPAPLTETGEKMAVQYSAQLESLKTGILAALPILDEQKKAAYAQACQTEAGATADLKMAEKALREFGHSLGEARGVIEYYNRRQFIPKSQAAVKAAQARLDQATTDAERNKWQRELTKRQEVLANQEATFRENQGILDENEPALQKRKDEVQEAREALTQAKADILTAIEMLGLLPILKEDQLDGRLARYVLLKEATPRGLALFAQDGSENSALIARLLADDALMVEMAVADGPNRGRLDQAMAIYSDIQKASPKAKEGVLQRLALAIALEHAFPVRRRNRGTDADAPMHVDPLERYRQFEQAYMNGELDPGFKDHSTWSLRMVVDGNEPEDIAVWGRQMLRNFRPDHVTNPDQQWRYVAMSKGDSPNTLKDTKYDRPDLQFYQNILMNGGICGRRAFFARFLLRSFGVPTTARPQSGHGALARWTPDGWVTCLGKDWGGGWTETRYGRDLDFLANTRAREDRTRFLEVKRMQWIGDVMDENPVYGIHGGEPGFWYGISLYWQRAIVQAYLAAKATAVTEEQEPEPYAIPDADRIITMDDKGVITIPAAACTKPTTSTAKIIFMPSNLGGTQLHYFRKEKDQPFEYVVDVPAAGTYALTARVVTPSWKQHLFLSVNGAKNPIEIPLPFTVGMWETTSPVKIALVKGKNVLTFTRRSDESIKGVTIRDFTLTPLER